MKRTLVVFVLLFATLCSATREYTIVILNDTDGLITDARVMFNGFTSLAGAVGPRFEKVHGGITTPLPDTVVVQWRSSDGVLHRQTVSIHGVKPHEFAGEPEYWFIIRANGTVDVRGSRPE